MSAAPALRTGAALQNAAHRSSDGALARGSPADHALAVLLFAAAAASFYKLGAASYVWLFAYGACAVVCVRDRERLIASLSAGWPVFLFAMFCMLSVFWSVDPAASATNAAQYLVTAVMALWIGSAFSVAVIFRLLSFTLLGCVVVSVVATYGGIIEGFAQDDYVGAERYFTGLYTQKNVMGNVIALAALATLVAGTLARRVVLAYGVTLAMLPLLLMTKSTTSLLQYLAVVSSFLPVLWLTASARHKLPVVTGFAIVLLAASFAIIAADVDVVGAALAAIGKDATLTGRTVIWNEGMAVFLDRPLLGVGYQAFWSSPEFADVVSLVRAAVLESVDGFHNGYLEAAVATGVAGLALYVSMIAYAVVTNGKALLDRPTAASLGAAYLVLHIVTRTFTESALYYQHDIELILLIALTVAARRAAQRLPEQTP